MDYYLDNPTVAVSNLRQNDRKWIGTRSPKVMEVKN